MDAREPRDLSAVDRLVSRSVAVIGAIALVIVWQSSGQSLPRGAVVAFALAYAVGKLAVAIAGLIQRWPAWPAALAEALALDVVAAIVWTGTRQPVYLVLVAALLGGAGVWRRRVARLDAGDGE